MENRTNFIQLLAMQMHRYRRFITLSTEVSVPTMVRIVKETSAKVEKQRNAYNWNLTGNERASATTT